VIWTNTRNELFIAAVSGAKTRVFTFLSTGTSSSTVVEVNVTLIFSDTPL
jgi:hypothetical protein